MSYKDDNDIMSYNDDNDIMSYNDDNDIISYNDDNDIMSYNDDNDIICYNDDNDIISYNDDNDIMSYNGVNRFTFPLKRSAWGLHYNNTHFYRYNYHDVYLMAFYGFLLAVAIILKKDKKMATVMTHKHTPASLQRMNGRDREREREGERERK